MNIVDPSLNPPPELEKYIENMKVYGEKYAKVFTDENASFDEKLAAYYYDAGRIYFQIADYLQDYSTWTERGKKAVTFYVNEYVLPNNGQVPGYWNFSNGIVKSIHLYWGGETLKKHVKAIQDLSLRAAYAPPTTPIEDTIPSTMSRDVAYNILTSLNAEAVELPKAEHFNVWINQAVGHFNQWFVSRTAPYIRPFMVALSAEALICVGESMEKGEILFLHPIKQACDEMWATMWIADKEAFMYTNIETPEGGTEPAPDLNLLICPMYAWVYKETGDSKYLECADKIFAGGVKHSYLGSPKHFNQNYRWSFKYLEWREYPDKQSEYETTFPPGTIECTNYFLKQIRDLLLE